MGFDIVDFGGRSGVLARKGIKSGPKTGEYTIMVDSFEKIALPSIKVPRRRSEHVRSDVRVCSRSEETSTCTSSVCVWRMATS